MSKIKSKFSRSLSYVIFESVFFCSFALVICWIKGLSQTQHMCKQTIHHSRPVPSMPGQGNSSHFSFSFSGKAQPSLRPKHDKKNFMTGSLLSSAKVKHWPKVNSHPQKQSHSQSHLVMGQCLDSTYTALRLAHQQPSELHCDLSHSHGWKYYFIRHSLHLPQKCQWGLS